MHKNINVMVNACRKASKTLIRDFGEVEKLQVSEKGPGDFVTAADKRVEKTLIKELSNSEYSILTEEQGEIEGKNKEKRWIIDPIDGTTNFLNGLPHFGKLGDDLSPNIWTILQFLHLRRKNVGWPRTGTVPVIQCKKI